MEHEVIRFLTGIILGFVVMILYEILKVVRAVKARVASGVVFRVGNVVFVGVEKTRKSRADEPRLKDLN